MKPTGTYLHLKVIPIEHTTASGIVLSPMSGRPPGEEIIEEYAEVVAVGPQVTVAKPGDRVYFKEYNLDRIKTGPMNKPEIIVFIDEQYVLATEEAHHETVSA